MRRNVLLLALLLLPGCATEPKWEVTASPVRQDLRSISPDLDDGSVPSFHAAEVPDVPQKTALRPCCAFGRDLKVSAGFVPVPGFSVGNVKGVEDIGHHNYDAGVLTQEKRTGSLKTENNGQVYTCRGGFIDTAHVRDYADYTVYLTAQLLRAGPEDDVIELPHEGGTRRVVISPLFFDVLYEHGWEASVPLARWLAYRFSIWHEIIQWLGWTAVPTYPEKVSAFSPEDLYSNLLGTRIAAALVLAYLADSEPMYNGSMNLWVADVLTRLGAVPADVGREVMGEVDGLWWDSSRRLPDWKLVKRRRFETGPRIGGWLATEADPSPELRALLQEHCGDQGPVLLEDEQEVEGIPFRELATIEIEVEDKIADVFPFPRDTRLITQEDFPGIIAAIRADNAAEMGPDADRPEP